MNDESPDTPETSAEQAARLVWSQAIAIQESITPPAIFRPAQRYCWSNKLALIPRSDLIVVINEFASDKLLRTWVQDEGTPTEVFTLWEAIAEFSRRFFILNDDEKPDPIIVSEVRLRPGAKDIFTLELRLTSRE